jgi:hypothetical protein
MLWTGNLRNICSIPGVGKGVFSSKHLLNIHIGSGNQPASSFSIGMWALSPGVSQEGCEADYSPPFGAEVKIEWTYPLPTGI